MLHTLIDLFKENNDPARLRFVIAKQRDLLIKANLKIAQLTHENRQLRRRLRDAELRLVDKAVLDATLIGGLYFSGLPISRRACYEVGISERSWTRSIALLKTARLYDNGRMRAETTDDYERGLRVARERIVRDGMESLRHRMPLSRQ